MSRCYGDCSVHLPTASARHQPSPSSWSPSPGATTFIMPTPPFTDEQFIIIITTGNPAQRIHDHGHRKPHRRYHTRPRCIETGTMVEVRSGGYRTCQVSEGSHESMTGLGIDQCSWCDEWYSRVGAMGDLLGDQ